MLPDHELIADVSKGWKRYKTAATFLEWSLPAVVRNVLFIVPPAQWRRGSHQRILRQRRPRSPCTRHSDPRAAFPGDVRLHLLQPGLAQTLAHQYGHYRGERSPRVLQHRLSQVGVDPDRGTISRRA